ncbi:MAG: hypothetical protein ACLVIU_04660 [Paraclostridium sp.]|nr:hypothetical protein [Paeniclostridium sordellii]
MIAFFTGRTTYVSVKSTITTTPSPFDRYKSCGHCQKNREREEEVKFF